MAMLHLLSLEVMEQPGQQYVVDAILIWHLGQLHLIPKALSEKWWTIHFPNIIEVTVQCDLWKKSCCTSSDLGARQHVVLTLLVF